MISFFSETPISSEAKVEKFSTKTLNHFHQGMESVEHNNYWLEYTYLMEIGQAKVSGRSLRKGMLDPWKNFSPGLGVKNWTKFIWGERQ